MRISGKRMGNPSSSSIPISIPTSISITLRLKLFTSLQRFLLFFLISTWILSVNCQDDQDTQVSSPTLNPTATSISPISTSTSSSIQQVEPTSSLIELQDSVPISTELDSNSQSPAFFHLDSSKTTSDSTPDGSSIPVYISISICSGPDVPAYDVSNKTLLDALGLSTSQARRMTQVRLYVSDSADNVNPGPENLPRGGNDATGNGINYAFGGYSMIEFRSGTRDGAWIAVWPPEDMRGESGTYSFQITAATRVLPNRVSSRNAIMLDDTDNNRALLSSYNYSIDSAPNLNLFILPTSGQNSISPTNYNSSLCAISSLWNSLPLQPPDPNPDPDVDASSDFIRPSVNQSETSRGIISVPVKPGADLKNVTQTLEKQRRLQFEISGLQSGTNYTAWMASTNLTDGVQVQTLYPAIKFLTKSADNCRLVFDVPFCPNVAYSIPVGPSIPTETALSIINETVSPNFQNFTTTLNTFPCGDDYFGDYSPVRTCSDCSRAYQDWLCSVTMPRCTDYLTNQTLQSSSPSTSRGLGKSPDKKNNTDSNIILPYITNRNGEDGTESRQSYIDDGLMPGNYAEILPCDYTCHYVTMSCPNIIQWNCPIWDITSQVDYGAFADSNDEGIGEGYNGGAGPDGSRWGGPTRYIATDAFGNVYCNALGTDLRLRQENSAFGKFNSKPTIWLSIGLSCLSALILPHFLFTFSL